MPRRKIWAMLKKSMPRGMREKMDTKVFE